MNINDSVQAVANKGFTERQARFLVLVMRHAGVCVMRQYSAFAGIVFGQKTRCFFDKLVTRGYASTYDCSHNRARIFHVRHRALYEAIGEPDSRLRRPPAVPRALERLMLLDAILVNPEIVWLSAPEEKVAHLTTLAAVSREKLPHVVAATAAAGAMRQVRFFPDRLPVGIHPEGRVALVYLVSDPLHEDLRGFLQRHAAMLIRLPAWTLRIVVPPHLGSSADHWRQAAWNHLATPLREPVLGELRWYFERLLDVRSESLAHAGDARFQRAAQPHLPRAWPVPGPASGVAHAPVSVSNLCDGELQILIQIRDRSASQSAVPRATDYTVVLMVVLRCTQQLLLRLKRLDNPPPGASTTLLGDWYGNVIRMGRRHALLFISEHSRLPVPIPVRQANRLAVVFPDAVCAALAGVGVPQSAIDRELSPFPT